MRPQSQGIIAPIVAVALVALLGFAALVIDLGLALVTRNQLQNIADGAALAGTRQLSRIYAALAPEVQQGYVLTSGDKSAVLAKVRELGEKNAAGGKPIGINTDDVVIGQWDLTTRHLTPTYVNPDAVSVLARRDERANSPLTTFFAGIVGTDRLNVSAWATAALTGVKEVGVGALNAPFGISRVWFENRGEFCDQPVQFSPTNSPEGCAGWHTFSQAANARNLRRILDDLLDGTFVSPAATAGETQFNFMGGEVPPAFQRLRMLYEAKAVCSTTGALCSASACAGTCEWSTFVGVYDAPNCANPNETFTIVGFATAIIYEVESSHRIVRGHVQCDMVQPNTRGGGALYGTKGSIPGLVQ